MEVDVKESLDQVPDLTDQVQDALVSKSPLAPHLVSHLQSIIQSFHSPDICLHLPVADLLKKLTTFHDLLQVMLGEADYVPQTMLVLPSKLLSTLARLLEYDDQYVRYLVTKCLSVALFLPACQEEREEMISQLMEGLNAAVMENERLAAAILDVFSLMFSTRKLLSQSNDDSEILLKDCRCQVLYSAEKCWKKLAAQFLLPKVSNLHMLESFLKLWKKLLHFQQSLNEEQRVGVESDWTKSGLQHAVMLVGNFMNRAGHGAAIYKAALKVLAALLPSNTIPTVSYQPVHQAIATLILKKMETGLITKCPQVKGQRHFGGTECSADFDAWVKHVNDDTSQVCATPDDGLRVDHGSLRRLVLLILRSCLVMLKILQIPGGCGLTAGDIGVVLNKMSEWVTASGQFADGDSPPLYIVPLHSWLGHVFADQDDQLVEAMIVSLDIYTTARFGRMDLGSFGRVPQLDQLNPHIVFLEFLHKVSHDHTVLLDLLTSPETGFLLYLIKYLHLVANTWDYLVHTCSKKESHGSFILECTPICSHAVNTQIKDFTPSSNRANTIQEMAIPMDMTEKSQLVEYHPPLPKPLSSELEGVTDVSDSSRQSVLRASAHCEGIEDTLLKYESSGRELAGGLSNLLHKITGERLRLAEGVLLNEVDDSLQQLQMSRDNMSYLLKEANAVLSEDHPQRKEVSMKDIESISHNNLLSSQARIDDGLNLNDVEPMDCETELSAAMERQTLKDPSNPATGIFPQLTYYSDSEDDGDEEPVQQQKQVSDLKLLQSCSQYLTNPSDCAALMTIIGLQSCSKPEDIVTYSDSDSDCDIISAASSSSTSIQTSFTRGVQSRVKTAIYPCLSSSNLPSGTALLSNKLGTHQNNPSPPHVGRDQDGVSPKLPTCVQGVHTLTGLPTHRGSPTKSCIDHQGEVVSIVVGLDKNMKNQVHVRPLLNNMTSVQLHQVPVNNSSTQSGTVNASIAGVVNYSDSEGNDNHSDEEIPSHTESHSCFHNIKDSFRSYQNVSKNSNGLDTQTKIVAISAYSDSSEEGDNEIQKMDEDLSPMVGEKSSVHVEHTGIVQLKKDLIKSNQNRKTSSSEIISGQIGCPPVKRKRFRKAKCFYTSELDHTEKATEESIKDDTLACSSNCNPHIDCECDIVKEENPSQAQKELDDMFAVLIRLRLGIERLSRHQLFPFNAKPLIAVLDKCESLYES